MSASPTELQQIINDCEQGLPIAEKRERIKYLIRTGQVSGEETYELIQIALKVYDFGLLKYLVHILPIRFNFNPLVINLKRLFKFESKLEKAEAEQSAIDIEPNQGAVDALALAAELGQIDMLNRLLAFESIKQKVAERRNEPLCAAVRGLSKRREDSLATDYNYVGEERYLKIIKILLDFELVKTTLAAAENFDRMSYLRTVAKAADEGIFKRFLELAPWAMTVLENRDHKNEVLSIVVSCDGFNMLKYLLKNPRLDLTAYEERHIFNLFKQPIINGHLAGLDAFLGYILETLADPGTKKNIIEWLLKAVIENASSSTRPDKVNSALCLMFSCYNKITSNSSSSSSSSNTLTPMISEIPGDALRSFLAGLNRTFPFSPPFETLCSRYYEALKSLLKHLEVADLVGIVQDYIGPRELFGCSSVLKTPKPLLLSQGPQNSRPVSSTDTTPDSPDSPRKSLPGRRSSQPSSSI